MYYNSNKMCYKSHDDLDESDYTTKSVRNNTGGYNKITYYADGTTTVHWGGPCGSTSYDENGQEC